MPFLRFTLLLCAILLSAPVSASTIAVPAGGNLQAALDSAACGDTIVLTPGVIYTGHFVLGAKSCEVVLTSGGVLPTATISPADLSKLATISGSASYATLDGTGARNWKLDGLHFTETPGGYGNDIIAFHNAENITIDRVLIMVEGQQKRGVKLNGRNMKVTRSFIVGVKKTGQDSQAIAFWNGAGPYTITHNVLEAASENVMSGGADSDSPEDIPADILIANNLLTKNPTWYKAGYAVKNLLELKSARRVKIINNVMENNWVDGQSGYAILFTPRNQDGTAPWSVVEDVEFAYNVVRNTPHIFNITGYDNVNPSGRTTGLNIHDNLLLSTGGRLAMVNSEVGSLTLNHNTFVSEPAYDSMIGLYKDGSIATTTGSRSSGFAVESFVFLNNMASCNEYGLHGNYIGTAGLDYQTLGYQWLNNVLGGCKYGIYPATTSLIDGSLFLQQFDANYFLTSSSSFKNAGTDGTDIGWRKIQAEDPPSEPQPDTTSSRLSALESIVSALANDLATAQNRLDALLTYLASTPDMGKVQSLIRYLRLVPR